MDHLKSAHCWHACDTPSGPPITKHRSRPSDCQSDNRDASAWLVNCVPLSSSKMTCSSVLIRASICSPSASIASCALLFFDRRAAAIQSMRNFHSRGNLPEYLPKASSTQVGCRSPTATSRMCTSGSLTVGRGQVFGRSERPEFLQIIKLAHFRQHDVNERILQI